MASNFKQGNSTIYTSARITPIVQLPSAINFDLLNDFFVLKDSFLSEKTPNGLKKKNFKKGEQLIRPLPI